MAHELALPTADKKDSQGFVSSARFGCQNSFNSKLSVKRGDIVEIDANHDVFADRSNLALSERAGPYPMTPDMGTVVGQHDGAHFFTVGQRKGLQVGGKPEPLFVWVRASRPTPCLPAKAITILGCTERHCAWKHRTGFSPASKRLHRAKPGMAFASATASPFKKERSFAPMTVNGTWISRNRNEVWLPDNLPHGMAARTART